MGATEVDSFDTLVQLPSNEVYIRSIPDAVVPANVTRPGVSWHRLWQKFGGNIVHIAGSITRCPDEQPPRTVFAIVGAARYAEGLPIDGSEIVDGGGVTETSIHHIHRGRPLSVDEEYAMLARLAVSAFEAA